MGNTKRYIVFFLFGGLLPLAMAEDALHMSVRSGKPLLDMCQQLETKFHWRISYEDPPVYWQDELEEGTAPSGVPWLVLRPVSVSVDIPAVQSASREVPGAAVKTILDAYHGNLNRATFQAIYSEDFIHIVPTAVRGADGSMQPFQPMLDTRVTIPRGSYLLLVFVSQIIAQVSNKTGIPIAEGTIPTNLFAQTMVTEEANDEPARDVLARVFNDVDVQRTGPLHPVRLTWYLGYSHNWRNYFFNVHPVGPEPGSLGSVNPQNATAKPPENAPLAGPPPKGSKFGAKN